MPDMPFFSGLLQTIPMVLWRDPFIGLFSVFYLVASLLSLSFLLSSWDRCPCLCCVFISSYFVSPSLVLSSSLSRPLSLLVSSSFLVLFLLSSVKHCSDLGLAGIREWETVTGYLFSLHSSRHIRSLSQDSRRWIVMSFKFELLSLVLLLKGCSSATELSLIRAPVMHVPVCFSLLWMQEGQYLSYPQHFLPPLSTAGIYIPPTHT